MTTLEHTSVLGACRPMQEVRSVTEAPRNPCRQDYTDYYTTRNVSCCPTVGTTSYIHQDTMCNIIRLCAYKIIRDALVSMTKREGMHDEEARHVVQGLVTSCALPTRNLCKNMSRVFARGHATRVDRCDTCGSNSVCDTCDSN